MLSRYERIQEKRQKRQGIFLILISALLITSVFIFGIPNLAYLASFIRSLKGEQPTNIEDKTPPGPPQLNALPRYVKDQSITITGNSEIPSTLKVYRNGEVIKQLEIKDTTEYSTTIPLLSGQNAIWTTATDPAGNESPASSIVYVTYDIEPPKIEVETPKDGEKFGQGRKNIEIKGKTEPGSRLTVNGRIANVDIEGNFFIKYMLSEGENKLVFEAKDEADNKSEKTITVVYSP
jgi:hypothetical protein